MFRPLLATALAVVPVAAAVRRAGDAWHTYEATGAAAEFGLTYDPRLPLDWLLVAVVTGQLVGVAGARFESNRSAARWLYGAALVSGALATVVGARDLSAFAVVGPMLLLISAAVLFALLDRHAGGSLHPSWLSDPRARIRGLVVGVAVTVMATGFGLAEDEHILPRSRALHEACWVVAIVGGLFAILCLGAVLVARAGNARALGHRFMVFGFFAALVFGAFATYSLGFHWKETVDLCRTVRRSFPAPQAPKGVPRSVERR